MENKNIVRIYTDGACAGNPGPGGYGVILLYNGAERRLSDGARHTTNNRMELLAAIVGLEALKRPCTVELYSDSRYVVDAVEQGWVHVWRANGWRRKGGKPAMNPDLWDRLLYLLPRHKVKFIWVKAHAGNEYNNLCDAMANAAINAVK
jgi:ribonuclease HI